MQTNSITWKTILCLTLLGGTVVANNDSVLGAEAAMQAVTDAKSGQVLIREGSHPVLQYNYQTIVPPKGYLSHVHANARKYAVPRSNYIHPLYGPDGEELTADWSNDHPHHRGIYWAWPEVQYQGELGDLHALQRVFSRPTGEIQLQSGEEQAQVTAKNVWKWNDKTPIVHEVATIVAHRAGESGRHIDLKFQFTALVDGVTLARRGTKNYGGLNTRLSPVKDLQLSHHADPESVSPRRAWSDSIGVRAGGTKQVGMAIFEKATNPDYPGDYVQFPNLPWFQPTFPRAGRRFELKKDETLVLEYRLWIRRGGAASEKQYDQQWRDYNKSSAKSQTNK